MMEYEGVQYTVGEKFPDQIKNFKPFMDVGATWRLRNQSFDVIVIISKPRPEEMETFRAAPFKYGVLNLLDVPVFLMRYEGGFSYECFFNIALERDHGRDIKEFLYSEANLVTFFLIDSSNYILSGMRAVGFDLETMAKIKEICRAQLGKYDRAEEVEAKIQELMKKYSHNELLKMVTLRKLPRPGME